MISQCYGMPLFITAGRMQRCCPSHQAGCNPQPAKTRCRHHAPPCAPPQAQLAERDAELQHLRQKFNLAGAAHGTGVGAGGPAKRQRSTQLQHAASRGDALPSADPAASTSQAEGASLSQRQHGPLLGGGAGVARPAGLAAATNAAAPQSSACDASSAQQQQPKAAAANGAVPTQSAAVRADEAEAGAAADAGETTAAGVGLLVRHRAARSAVRGRR